MELIDKYKVKPGKKFSLKEHHTDEVAGYKKEEAKNVLESWKEKLYELQEKIYAGNEYSVLIIFQAMDAAGKDSAIEHVMSGLNPQGCQVFSFKQPSAEEYDHDFLWRHYKALPEKGRIGIHNRSHYENVLVCKVHPEYVMSEHLPGYPSVSKINDAFWKKRYESIRNFEDHITANGTVVIKFFLHVSKEEQKQRFLDRINEPGKNWKFSSGDLSERKLWDQYMKAYEQALSETSTNEAPWYVIPADKKWFTRIAIINILVDTLNKLDLKLPTLSAGEAAKLADYRKQLEEES